MMDYTSPYARSLPDGARAESQSGLSNLPVEPLDVSSMASPDDADQQPSEEEQLHTDFGNTVSDLVRGYLSPTQAVRQLSQLCSDRAANHRLAAEDLLHLHAQHVMHTAQAMNSEAEAATFELIALLHGDDPARLAAGSGGSQLPACGKAITVRQRIADIIAGDSELNRVARVVAWLEALAAQELDRQADTAAVLSAVFAQDEGLPKETRAQLLGGRSHPELVTELDPDAPIRQGKVLAPGNVRDEERLSGRLWALVRAGRVTEAQQLCCHVSQHWRAAAYFGPGAMASVALGETAEANDAVPDALGQEVLAGETLWGGIESRFLWREICHTGAEQVGAHAERTGAAGKHDAALVGIFGSHLQRTLPACTSWEDCLWAASRCWLELAVDARLAQDLQDYSASLAAAAKPIIKGLHVLGADPLDGISDEDLLAACLQHAPPQHKTAQTSSQPWPSKQILNATPREWSAVFDVVSSRPVDESEWQHAHHAMQQAIIRGSEADMDALLSILQQSDDAMDDEQRQQGMADELSAEQLRCHSHIALSLAWLNMLPLPCANETMTAASEAVEALAFSFCVQLADGDLEAQVPLYACHLTQHGRRRLIKLTILSLLGSPVSRCLEFYKAALLDFFEWNASGMGSLHEQELNTIIWEEVQDSMRMVDDGPLRRALTAKWLLFDEQALRHPHMFSHINALLRDFALGDSLGRLAAAEALLDIFADIDSPLEVLRDHSQARESKGIDDSLVPLLAETCAWQTLFQLDRDLRTWHTAHAELAPDDSPDVAELVLHKLRLVKEGIALAGDLLQYIAEGQLDTACSGSGHVDNPAAPRGLHVVASAAHAGQQDASTLEAEAEGNAFALLPPDAVQALSEALQSSMQTLLASEQPGLEIKHKVGAAMPETLSGLLSLHAQPAERTAHVPASALAKLTALALKGHLPASENQDGIPPLDVAAAEGQLHALAALARQLLHPRLVLQSTELRLAVMSVISSLPADDAAADAADVAKLNHLGRQIQSLVAGSPSSANQGDEGYLGTARFFSQSELQLYLELDRQCQLACMAFAESQLQPLQASAADRRNHDE